MIAGGAAALINFLITSPPSFISLVREREEEIRVEAFHPPILSDPFLQSGQDMAPLGALVPPLHLQPRRSRRKTRLPSLVLVWLVPKALTGSVLEKEPPHRFHGTLCASWCHPAGTGHSLDDEEGQILVGMMCSASSSSGVGVRGGLGSVSSQLDSLI